MNGNVKILEDISYPQEERYLKLREELLDFILNVRTVDEKIFNFAGKELYIFFNKLPNGIKYIIRLDGLSKSAVSLEETPLDMEIDIMLFCVYSLEKENSKVIFN